VANGKLKVWYRKNAADKLEVVAKLKADDKDDAAFWNVVRLFAGRDDGLALKPGPSGHIALRKFNYATREVGDVIYENPEWDLDDFAMDEQGNATAVYFTDDEDHVVWLDPKTAKLQADFTKALGGTSARILQVARDKSRMLVQADAANNPGAWYVYTPATHQLGMFSSIRPELDPALLAPAKPVTYNARDGTRIRAYLTLPRGREAKSLPLIVMPHGGPYGIRDKLQYDDEVQLLANRGYAVLQPDYRGSGGFGQAFEDLGKGQIGRKMQDDLDDAMDWAVKQGIADPRRVCLVGGSYGGYAALWGVIRNPERYRCAASYAGVTDWQSQLSYDNDFFSRSERNAWREKIRGTDRSFDMTSVSPLKQVTLLKRPVLLGHGKQDHTVPFSEFEAMRNALGQNHIAGAEYVVLEKSPHGFADAKEKQAWLDALAAFLQKNNPAN
jgi:dipeptidyl aminopeptidase/acylaminoacyl peptidase